MKYLIFSLLTILLFENCSNGTQQKTPVNNVDNSTNNIEPSEENYTEKLEGNEVAETYEETVANIEYSDSEISKFAVAAIMNQSPKIINVKKKNDEYYVSYKRPDDGKFFDYKIKIDNNSIMWGAADGRWRDSSYDEKISYKISGEKIIIIQTFTDGSKSEKKYNK